MEFISIADRRRLGHKLPSEWSLENVAVIEGGWKPKLNDDCDMYVNGCKVAAVVQAYDGKTITFNWVMRDRATGLRAVHVVTQTVRFHR